MNRLVHHLFFFVVIQNFGLSACYRNAYDYSVIISVKFHVFLHTFSQLTTHGLSQMTFRLLKISFYFCHAILIKLTFVVPLRIQLFRPSQSRIKAGLFSSRFSNIKGLCYRWWENRPSIRKNYFSVQGKHPLHSLRHMAHGKDCKGVSVSTW